MLIIGAGAVAYAGPQSAAASEIGQCSAIIAAIGGLRIVAAIAASTAEERPAFWSLPIFTAASLADRDRKTGSDTRPNRPSETDFRGKS
jgi:hypothetical protein